MYIAHSQPKPCTHASSLIAMFKRFHVQPIALNDSTTDQIFFSFYKSLDVENIYFTAADIQLFDKYKPLLISNKYGDSVCTFIEKVTTIFVARIEAAEKLATSILEKPFDYAQKDSMLFSRMYIQRFAATEELKENRWRRKLKYDLVESLVTLYDTINFNNIDSAEFNKIESDLRVKLLKREKRMIQHILEYPTGTESYVAETFLNAIANRYDPHSYYFSIAGKNDFLASLSTESKSFGFTLTETPRGEIAIGRIIPGGPAYKSGILRQGDIIQQIIKPDGKILDMTFASEEEATMLINTDSYDNFSFVVRNLSGSRITVTLQKEILKVESNNTTGYLLSGEKKIAYIALPDFYTGSNPASPKGLSYDVAKELSKFKKQSINGLILDLRYNGGGAIQEAVSLCGLFIDQGPLFLMKFLKEHPQVIYDPSPGALYNGPLVLLVNGLSASASELVAATLQDYNRALIVGSQTFGKATAQYNLPLDSTMNIYIPKGEYNDDAFINITMEKMYRTTGKSLQNTGLTPDIILPDFIKNMQMGEAHQPFALEKDEVVKRVYLLKMPTLPIEKLKEKSLQRSMESPVLSLIKQISDSLSAITDSTKTIQIDFDFYKHQQAKQKTISDSIQNLVLNYSKSTPYEVKGKYYGKRKNKKNEYAITLEEAIVKQIKEDVYIREAYQILNDLISSSIKE